MNKKKYIIILSTLSIFIITIIIIITVNSKGKINWIKEVEKSNNYQITINNCNEKEVIVPNEVLKEIANKLNNISDNGPWTGDNDKCYNNLSISYSKENQIQYITIKLIDENSFVLSTNTSEQYYTNSKELNSYINKLINTY